MTAETTQLVLHTLVVLALLVAYCLVTLTGNDGTALLGVLGGYASGAGVQKVAQQQRSRA